MASLVAMLSVEQVFYQKASAVGGSDGGATLKRRKKFMNPKSDHIMLINVMRAYQRVRAEKGKHAAKAFCLEHSINEKSMYKAVQIK